ncbi:MAG: polyphenol oxidase family protein [Deferribacteraceae bacterium]|jgi:YfiH family protein|nr:polyphenol oxidase family protein [Deferribacteraceae bacterium]
MITVVKAAPPQGFTAMTTTADDGVSFSKKGDNAENYAEFKEQYGIDKLVTLDQQHGVEIIKVTDENYLSVNNAKADGLFTAESGIALGILTADCYPVLIAGAHSAAALHCGWRSAVGGIIEKVLPLFESERDLPQYAYIGAGISKVAYIVQDDFIDEISQVFKPYPYLSKIGDEWHFDLAQLISNRLNLIGVKDIQMANICTYASQRFFSYRREPECGRMLSVIYR